MHWSTHTCCALVVLSASSFFVNISGSPPPPMSQLPTRINRGTTSINLILIPFHVFNFLQFVFDFVIMMDSNKSKNKFTFKGNNILILYFMILLCYFYRQWSNLVDISVLITLLCIKKNAFDFHAKDFLCSSSFSVEFHSASIKSIVNIKKWTTKLEIPTYEFHSNSVWLSLCKFLLFWLKYKS